MNLINTRKWMIVVGMLIASCSAHASLLSHSFSYDNHTFSFSLLEQNANYDEQGYFVSTDLVAPEELFTFKSEELGLDIVTSDISAFDVFEVYFDEVLTNGIFSFVTVFTVGDLYVTLEYDLDFDIFDFIVEDLSNGDLIIDVVDFASSLQTEAIVVTEDDVVNASEPALYMLILSAFCLMLLRTRNSF